jgi:pimeloyl-ACP methyl ester carboxylesterase
MIDQLSASNIEHHEVELGDARIHYVTAGRGAPVVLLHGWPQSWYAWRRVIPLLADRYSLIAPDLRGLGDSSCPPSGYDKRTIARDIHQLVNGILGHERFLLVGHDWGGPVAYALAVQFPTAVSRLVILDVTIPGDGSPDISQGGRRWHHRLHQTPELPERLVLGREDIYLGWFYRNYGHKPDVLSDAEVNEYLRVYRRPGVLRAGFEYYRALSRDIADNVAAARESKLQMPVLALGGANSWGRGMEVVESLKRMASNVTGGSIANCGHWIPEEQPDLLARELVAFFERAKS